MKVELVVDSKCIIGEGPFWDEDTKKLHFVDLLDNKIYSYSDLEGLTNIKFDQNIGAVVVCEGGGMVAALQHGYYAINPETKETTLIGDPESNRQNSRFNDGKCDAKGRFWAGTMSKDLDSGYGNPLPESGLYCLDADGTISKKLDKVVQGNGITWNKDNTKMYFIDSQLFNVQEFDFDIETGNITNGKVIIDVPKELGLPDGMTMDDEGKLWIALWGGGCVSRWDPSTGKLLEKIKIPALNVTSCAFGGEDGCDLYVTTASLATDIDEYPNAGSVFKVRLEYSGMPSYKYKG